MTSTRSERAFAALQQELDIERAAVLGRTGRRLDEAIAVCMALGRRLEATTDECEPSESPSERTTRLGARAALLAEYRSARAESEEWRWRLCVQREAIGLTEHRWVDRVYPPPVVR